MRGRAPAARAAPPIMARAMTARAVRTAVRIVDPTARADLALFPVTVPVTRAAAARAPTSRRVLPKARAARPRRGPRRFTPRSRQHLIAPVLDLVLLHQAGQEERIVLRERLGGGAGPKQGHVAARGVEERAHAHHLAARHELIQEQLVAWVNGHDLVAALAGAGADHCVQHAASRSLNGRMYEAMAVPLP